MPDLIMKTFRRSPLTLHFSGKLLGRMRRVRLIYTSYDNLASLEAMSTLPNFRRCLAAGCESGQIHFEGAAQPIMTCGACRRKTCFTHEIEWHEGRTCDQVNEELRNARRVERRANDAYFITNTKRCPNETCGRRIEKDGGCQHMTCKPGLFVFL